MVSQLFIVFQINQKNNTYNYKFDRYKIETYKYS